MLSNREKLAEHLKSYNTSTTLLLDGGRGLDARYFDITDSLLPEFIQYVSTNKFAEIDFCFSSQAFPLLAALLPLNQFKSLSFFNPNPGTDYDEKHIASAMVALQKATTLKSLSFPLINSAANMSKITSAVKTNQSLTYVSFILPEEKEQQQAAKAIAEDIIKGSPRIQKLSLHAGSKLEEETLAIIIKALETNTKLIGLYLHDVHKLSDDKVRLLLDITNTRKQPIKLALHYRVQISDEGRKLLEASQYIGHIAIGNGFNFIRTLAGYALDAAESKVSAHHATKFGSALLTPKTVTRDEPSKQLTFSHS